MNTNTNHRNLSRLHCIFGMLILAFMLSFNSAVAQNKTWSYGPELGLSLAKYRGDANNHDFKTGLVAGGHVTYSNISTYGITLKALYHQKGTRYEADNVEYKERLNYLELPLMGRFFLNREGKFRPNLFAGPSFAFLLGAKNKVGDEDFKKVSDEQRDEYNSFDLGLTGGIGLNYLIMNETRLLFDIRYTHGLTDLRESNTASIYNQGLAFTLGLSYGWK